jgi:hypothetical protein
MEIPSRARRERLISSTILAAGDARRVTQQAAKRILLFRSLSLHNKRKEMSLLSASEWLQAAGPSYYNIATYFRPILRV